MILGIDVSTYLEELEAGAKYYRLGEQIDPLEEFSKNGVNVMRIRVWNDPYSESGEPYLAGSCNMEHYVKLARLAKRRGYDILLDFHYSDFWADPGKQMIPKAWRNYEIDEMVSAVYSFTKECLDIALKEDVAPAYIQVGNEITNGILWPIGRLSDATDGGERGNYGNLCRLLDAGSRACREALPEAKIILHLERSNDKAVYREFFNNMDRFGVDYDIIGASYYPYWHGTPDELFDNLRECRRYGKQIMVVELGYGFTTKGYTLNGEEKRLVIDPERAYVPGISEKYPLTPEGQRAFIDDFLKRAKSEGVDGIFYWEPLWLPGEGICWASEAGQAYIHEEGKSTANEWANQCLFDYEGKALPAFDAFKL